MNRKTFGRTTVEAAEIDVRAVGPEQDEKLRNSRSHQMGGWAHKGTDCTLYARHTACTGETFVKSLGVSSTEKTKSK
ncbi:hypothetical protein AMD24_00330 [Candidatus Xiphinematobacter sp. Idaho Grape]|nr:hypothetical protein AMD24_00330 [Candidatus Xiphinematobacter sp. Idaho Grape]